MFKYFLILLISYAFLFSQDEFIYTSEEVLAIDNYIIELEQKDSINTKIIDNLENQIYMYTQRLSNDSTIINLKDLEIQTLNEQIRLHKDLIKEVTPKWYNNKWIWFTLGIVTTSGSIHLAGQLVN